MILIDTNVILATINEPVTPQDSEHHSRATALLGKVSRGTEQALISEIVLHECFYVLVMRDRRLSVDRFCSIFRRFLEWPGWAMSRNEKEIYVRALDLLEYQPKLEYSDAVIAARAEAHGAVLATFDKRLADTFGGTIWAES